MKFPPAGWEAHSAGNPGETQITSLRDVGSFGKAKPQKTRPPAEYDAHAALPCPDIEIGSRQPGGPI
jgi:hypothetical protein